MRYYSSTAVQTTLSTSVSSSATTITVEAVTGFPVNFPYTLILDLGTTSEEIVDVTNSSGNALTVTRGVDGTSAVSHSVGGSVVHGVSARDLRESQEHIAASQGVHGLPGTSNVVGTDATQTLSNKTIEDSTISDPSLVGGSWTNPSLVAPTIADFTNAQHDHSAATKGGAIPESSVTGLTTDLATIQADVTSLDGRADTLEAQGKGLLAAVQCYTVWPNGVPDGTIANLTIVGGGTSSQQTIPMEITQTLDPGRCYKITGFLDTIDTDKAGTGFRMWIKRVPSGGDVLNGTTVSVAYGSCQSATFGTANAFEMAGYVSGITGATTFALMMERFSGDGLLRTGGHYWFAVEDVGPAGALTSVD